MGGQWIDFYFLRAGPVSLLPDFPYLNNPNPEVGVDWGTQDSLHNPRPNHCRQPRKPEGRCPPDWSFAQSWTEGSWGACIISYRAGGTVCSSLKIERCLASLLATGLPGAQSSLKRRNSSRKKEAAALDEKVEREENETNKGWRELSEAEENVNGSALELQSLSWIRLHPDASAVTYRILTKGWGLQIITAWLSQSKKKCLLRWRREKLLGDSRPSSASWSLTGLFCVRQQMGFQKNLGAREMALIEQIWLTVVS